LAVSGIFELADDITYFQTIENKIKMDLKVLLSVFTVIFIAELGFVGIGFWTLYKA